MKILHLLPYIPTPPTFGGALRIYHILKHLHKHHDVTVAGFSNSGDPAVFFESFPVLKDKAHFLTYLPDKRLRRLTQFYALFTGHSHWFTTVSSGSMQQLIDRLLAKQPFDVIQSEFPTMGIFDFSKSNAAKILDAHNVEYDNFKRMANLERSKIRRFFYRRECEKFYNEEIEVCRKQTAIFTTSGRDRDLFNEDIPKVPKFVIPNGVDTTYFCPSPEEPEHHSLVFTGMMGYVPNYDGILYFLDKILPFIRQEIPCVKTYIVGKNPPKMLKQRASGDIVVTGFVEDVRPWVWKSRVYVVPLRMGGGTRLKVLEALAMKKPVVTTTIGCEGIDVRHGETALIANEPEAFSEAVVRLFRDRALREKLIRNGYEFVKKRYEWSVIGHLIEDAYSEILNSRKQEIEENAINST